MSPGPRLDAPVRLRAWRLAIAVAISVLAVPAAADAHLRSGTVATDYRATLDRPPPVVASAARLRIYATDRALALTVTPGNVVRVLGPSGTSMLMVDDRNGSRTRTVVWHDARVRRLPAGVDRGSWAVPLIVDGRRTRIHGRLWHLRAPPPWLWLLAGLPFILAAALLRNAPRRTQTTACAVVAAVAVAATVLIAVGFAASRSATPGRILEGFDELATAAVGVFFLVRGTPERRQIATVGLGFLAVFAGCLKLPVLTHGGVLSALPADAARAAVVVGLWSGIAAIIAGGWLLATSPRSSTTLVFPAPR